jgi:hypothetical protein
MNTLSVRYDNKIPVGTLTVDNNGSTWFQYAPEWLTGGFVIYPLFTVLFHRHNSVPIKNRK